MKEQSYPSATISFSTFMNKAELEIGSVVMISHSKYGLNSAYYRIISKGLERIDKNKITFVATQVVEKVFDSNFISTAGSTWVPPSHIPEHPSQQRVFEMPFNPISGEDTAYLLLSTKGTDTEIGFLLLTSLTSGGEFKNQGVKGENSLYSVLKEDYLQNTYQIDDEQGILLQPQGNIAKYNDLSRKELFSNRRFILIGDEIMGFQTIDPEGTGVYRLKGVIRGLYNTPIQDHTIDSPAWIFTITNNLFIADGISNFYLKMIPTTASAAYDPNAVIEHNVVNTHKAKKPINIARIEAIRIGTTVNITWWNITKKSDGAGTFDPGPITDNSWPFTDEYPFLFDGYFEYRINGGAWFKIEDTRYIHNDGSEFVFEIREVTNQISGNIKQIVVGMDDGKYVC